MEQTEFFSVENLIHINNNNDYYEILSFNNQIYLSYLFTSSSKEKVNYDLNKLMELQISPFSKPSNELIKYLLIYTAK